VVGMALYSNKIYSNKLTVVVKPPEYTVTFYFIDSTTNQQVTTLGSICIQDSNLQTNCFTGITSPYKTKLAEGVYMVTANFNGYVSTAGIQITVSSSSNVFYIKLNPITGSV
jgi:hypothetical protein